MTDESRIREIAYQIWLVEGQPEGQHERHWDMARKLVEAEQQQPPSPSTATESRPKPVMAPPPPSTERIVRTAAPRKHRQTNGSTTRPVG